MEPLTTIELVSLITQKVVESWPALLAIIASCAGIKIVLDLIWDYTMGITGRNRGR